MPSWRAAREQFPRYSFKTSEMNFLSNSRSAWGRRICLCTNSATSLSILLSTQYAPRPPTNAGAEVSWRTLNAQRTQSSISLRFQKKLFIYECA